MGDNWRNSHFQSMTSESITVNAYLQDAHRDSR